MIDLDRVAPPIDGEAIQQGDVVWLRSGGEPMTVEDPLPDDKGEIGVVFWERSELWLMRLAPACLTRLGR